MCDPLKTLLIICCTSICVLISDTYEQRDGNNNVLSEDSSCQQLGILGICQKVKDCAVALDLLKHKGRHNLKRCGIEDFQEIVCCPSLAYKTPLIETSTFEGVIGPGDVSNSKRSDNVDNHGKVKIKRKCEKMCDKIYADNDIKPDTSVQILGGENASKGQFPHVGALGFENSDSEIEWTCTASLISSRFLLTAAHCFICSGCNAPKKARLGVIDMTDPKNAQDIDVLSAIPHDKYDPISKHNDLGLIELARDVQMSKTLYPACLYTEVDDPVRLEIVGWGQTVNNDAESKARVLQYDVIQPVPIKECNSTIASKYKSSKTILDTQICATIKQDACVGDSGGPLQIKQKEGGYAIVGIGSFGIRCDITIYTRVSRYLDWIESMVWPN